MQKDKQNIPQSVAIIMDGNGRWAEARGEDRSYGHFKGVESVREAIKAAIKCGVSYLTLYAFSTENWARPQAEVDAIMELLCKSIINEKDELTSQGVAIKTIGDIESMSPEVQKHLNLIKEQTSKGENLTLILALNYSSRSEITAAVKSLAQEVKDGKLDPSDIDYKVFESKLYTCDFPDPDLIIRTSGECRLSNFLLTQAAYSEFYFTPVLWPDFRIEHFEAALEEYSNRNRRFGLVK